MQTKQYATLNKNRYLEMQMGRKINNRFEIIWIRREKHAQEVIIYPSYYNIRFVL